MQYATITLTVPLKRGENEITSINLSKPHAGQLRGVSLRDCLEMQTDSTVTLLPRISDPQITAVEVQKIDPCDLLQIAAAIANFFLPPSILTEAAQNFASQTE